MATSGFEDTEAVDRRGRPGLSVGVWKLLALALAAAALGAARSGQAQTPVLPVPAYENTLQIGYFCLDDCTATDQSMQAKADVLRAKVGEGPYLRLALGASANVDMLWPLPADPTQAQLSPQVETSLRTLLARAQRAGIQLNVSSLFGMTRDTGFYGIAVTEDRRNAQWYADGKILRGAIPISSTDETWTTLSRYARRVRRHLETKVRAYTRLLATLRNDYPGTLASIAADGEVELNSGELNLQDNGTNPQLPYQQQILADYSPFAIAEFRDWARNTGLYGPGGPFAGQGRAASGAKYATGNDAVDLASFDTDFSVSFGSWRLRYFDWDLLDPIDADPNAVTPAEFVAAGWDPIPYSGPRFLAGGFDAPRAWNGGSPAFWNLWLEFRQALVANYVKDVGTWMTSTVTPEGWSVSRDRIYTYQIPGDYLYGSQPGIPAPGSSTPDKRYLTSASTLASADTGGIVSLGVTAFDEYCWSFQPRACPVPPSMVGAYYQGTSDHLFPAVASRKPFNWGLVESNLSISISAVETSKNVIAARISRGRDAGMHLYGYYPDFTTDPLDTNGVFLDAVGVFAQTAKSQPYDAALRNYAPPPVRGVTATAFPDHVGLAWADTIFAESPTFHWAEWGDFYSFNVFRASAPDAPPASWQFAGTAFGNSLNLALPSLSAANSWYFVRAMSRKGLGGAPTAVLAPCPFPGIPSISVSTPFVRPGVPVTVTWQISNAQSATFAGSAVPPGNGSRTVSPFQTMAYKLSASNGCGASEASVTVNVDPGTGPLGPPVIKTPGSGQVLGLAGVTASWNAMAGATGYDLRLWDGQSGATVFTGSLVGSASTSTLLTLPQTNGSYLVGVRACGGGVFTNASCGMYATRSFSVNLITPTGVPTVTFPTNGSTLTASTQTLAWTAVAMVDPSLTLSYEVLLTDIAGGNKPELQITVPDPGVSTIYSLHGSGRYELKVRACQAGCGPWSAPVSFAVSLPAVPTGAPGITGCTVSGGNNLTCGWNAVAGADLYQIYVVQPPPAGPGGGALTVAARVVSATTVTLPVPAGVANVVVAACNGDGCGPFSNAVGISPAGPNPAVASLGTPLGGSIVSGPTVVFSWNRIPGDNGSNTIYRLFVQDLSRQSTALDVYTTQNFWAAYFKAEGARYDALVVANPGPSQVMGPAQGFNVSGTSASAPTMVSPGHQSSVKAGNVQLGWSPVLGAGLYQYYIAAQVGSGVVTGVTPGLVVQVPLGMVGGAATPYSGITRACPAGTPCTAGSDAGWGPWSNVLGGPGVTNFTVTP